MKHAEALSRGGGEGGGLGREFLRVAAERPEEVAVLDSRGGRLTYRELSEQALALARRLEAGLGDAEETPRVGVLLPPGAAGALVNVALAFTSRASVNLNPLAGPAGLAEQAAQAGLARVITSRAAFDAFGGGALFPGGGLFVEDLLAAAAHAGEASPRPFRAPREPSRAERESSSDTVSDATVATVLFSSGSTSRPKAIQLSHGNVLFNARAVAAAFDFGPGDRLLGVLPLFHSFGYTVTVWAPLLAGASVVFHDNPLDARAVGELAAEHRATVLLATPAMYQAWMRRIEKEQLASVRAAVAGAQRLLPALAAAWRERYGSEIYEGYGCTELSPVVAANLPDRPGLVRRREGTVGRPLPGVEVEIRDPATGRALPAGRAGDVWVRGGGVMQGYLGNESATRGAIVDGWYDTQDVGVLDEDGFLALTDRRSRFSKIGGEMVSHGAVECALVHAATSLGEPAERLGLAVTAVPDEQRGERLVVLHTPLEVGPEAVLERARKDGLANLCAPRAADWHEIPALPYLGTGKLDLAKLKALAVERAAAR